MLLRKFLSPPVVVVVVVLLFYVHGKHLRSCRDGQLTSGLEKSSVLPVLDRFLSLKTDFVLNRKQKNRSIKVRFFPSNSQ